MTTIDISRPINRWSRRSWAAALAVLLGVALARPALAGTVPTAGALGDSLVDEYRFADDPADRQAARSFVELLASAGRFDFGTFSTTSRGEPRRQGYANNWARSGARTADLAAQTPGLAAQVAQGQVTYGLVLVGGDDFRDVAIGGADPQTTVANGISRTATAVLTLLGANPGARVAVGNVPDVTRTPAAQLLLAQHPALGAAFAQLSGLVDAYNGALAAQFANNGRVALVDTNGVFKQILANPNMVVPGVTLDTRTPGTSPSHLFVDLIHPGTIGQGLLANAYIDAIDTKFGEAVPDLTGAEIIAAANAAANGPPSVPLPAAAWSVVALVPLLALATGRSRRRAGRSV